MGHHTVSSRMYKLNAPRKVIETKIKNQIFCKRKDKICFITVLVVCALKVLAAQKGA